MVVEDSDDYAFLLSRALNHIRRFQIVWRAKDRHEAIAYLAGTGQFGDRQRFPYPEAVLLDMRLPETEDGFAVLEWVAQQKTRPKVVMMTVLQHEAQRQKALNAGTDEFKVKPYEDKELTEFARWLDEWIGKAPRPAAPRAADAPQSQTRSQKSASPDKPRHRGSARGECEAGPRRRSRR
jgi:DNA-binding response OmpR family regulator